MSESTLRLKTQAELQQLKEYASGVANVRKEVDLLTESTRRYNEQTGGGGGGGAPGGAAPPGGGGGGPPGGGGSPGPGSGRQRGPMGFMGGFATGMPTPQVAHQAYTMFRDEGGRAAGGYLAGTAISRSAQQITQMGLGSSLMGFAMQSGTEWLQLSKILRQVSMRFKETGGDATDFGAKLGFTRAQSAQLVEALGQQTDVIGSSGRALSEYAGFARTFGMDPTRAVAQLGGMQRLAGDRQLTTADLTLMRGGAQQIGMGQGRLPEFMQGLMRVMEEQTRLSGRADVTTAMQVMQVPHLLFGAGDERARGQMGMQSAAMLGGLVSGTTSRAGRMFQLMGTGFGAEDGPSLMQAEMQLAKGLDDPRNLDTLMKTVNQMAGDDPDNRYFVLTRMLGMDPKDPGQMGVITALTTRMGDKDFQKKVEADALLVGAEGGLGRVGLGERNAMLAAGMEGMSNEEKLAAFFGDTSFAQMGRQGVSAGEAFGVRKEAMAMATGGEVAKLMISSQKAMLGTAQAIQKVLGERSIGAMVDRVAAGIEGIPTVIEEVVSAPGEVLKASMKGWIHDGFVGALKEAGEQYMESAPSWTLAGQIHEYGESESGAGE